MKSKIYVIKDIVAGYACAAILLANNDAELKRNCVVMFQQKQINFLNEHPDDIQIFCIGSFDKETMAIVPCNPDLVITGTEIRDTVLSELRFKKKMMDDLLNQKQKDEIENEIARNKGEVARDA